MGKLEECGRKKDAQLRRNHKYFKAPKGFQTFEVSDRDFYGNSKEMALLSPLARARRSMEWELSNMLCRPPSKGGGWKSRRAHDLRALAKDGGRKTGSSKGRI